MSGLRFIILEILDLAHFKKINKKINKRINKKINKKINMDVKDYIEKIITDLKLDGLVSEDEDCCCDLEDLFEHCGGESTFKHCEPGHKIICDCGFDCNFHIVKDK